jgi:starvation-inducible DNA-binding protein
MTTTLDMITPSKMDVNIGIESQARQEDAAQLSRVLADTYTLYLQTHNFHWNVTGKRFVGLHNLLREQYTEMIEAIDEIAERIRALGFYTPATYTKLSQLTSLTETEEVPKSEEMVRILVDNTEKLIRTAREALQRAEAANDAVTADLLTERMEIHEKNAWMLRSILED